MLQNPTGWLFDATALAPHGFCLLWEPWLIWSHAVANVSIALAYFSIPVALIVFVRRRQDLAMKPVFWLFAAFILLCGAGHLVDLATIWTPVYRLEAVVKITTATVSVATAAALWPLIPKALALPSPAQLSSVNQALIASEARHRASFLRSPMALHTLDANGAITGVSDRWLDLLGYTREEAIGRPLEAFLAPGSPHRHLAETLAAGEERDLERRFRRRDGQIRDVLVSTRVEHPLGVAPWLLGALVDVTERNRAEAALRDAEERHRQTQRMEALGQLAGGIAHDFNNVLQVVLGAVSVIQAAPERTDQVKRLSHLAAEAARRGASTSNRLLTFARRSDLRAVPVDPAGLLHGLAEMLGPTLGSRVMLEVDAPAGLPPLLADRDELETALINLATNARDAMPNGGSVRLSARAEAITGDEVGGEGSAPRAGLAAGEYLRIDVIDTGTGMDERVLTRASEPFFTTKPLGKGTGLGLSMARGFAQQSSGALAIDSGPGRGTRISLWLPRAAPPAAIDATQAAPPCAAHATAPRVLLVDDEPSVRAVLAAGLAGSGFVVIEADDGAAALKLLTGGERPDLLVTDLSMPGMDGLALIAAARARLAGLPAILLTGHPGSATAPPEPGAFALLPKPTGAAELATAIGTLLARHRAA